MANKRNNHRHLVLRVIAEGIKVRKAKIKAIERTLDNPPDRALFQLQMARLRLFPSNPHSAKCIARFRKQDEKLAKQIAVIEKKAKGFNFARLLDRKYALLGDIWELEIALSGLQFRYPDREASAS